MVPFWYANHHSVETVITGAERVASANRVAQKIQSVGHCSFSETMSIINHSGFVLAVALRALCERALVAFRAVFLIRPLYDRASLDFSQIFTGLTFAGVGV